MCNNHLVSSATQTLNKLTLANASKLAYLHTSVPTPSWSGRLVDLSRVYPLRGQNPAGAQANVQTVAADICVQSSATFTHLYGSRLHRNVMRFDNSILSGADMSAVGWNHRLYGSHVIAKGR